MDSRDDARRVAAVRVRGPGRDLCDSRGHQVINNYLTISIGQMMVNDLRARLFDHLQRLSLAFHRRREIGDLMVRITYDTFSMQTIAMNGFFPVLAAMVLLGGMFAVMMQDRRDLDDCRARDRAAVVRPDHVDQRTDRSAGERVARERGHDVNGGASRAFRDSRGAGVHARRGVLPRIRRRQQREPGRKSSPLHFSDALSGGVGVMIAVGTAWVIYLGARHVLEGRLSIGDLIVFTDLSRVAVRAGQPDFSNLRPGRRAQRPGCADASSCWRSIRKSKTRPGARTLARARGEIEFDQVVFGYEPGQPVLSRESASAPAGTKDRDRRTERRGEDHDGVAAGALLRRAIRRDPNRRYRCARGVACVATARISRW